jgi:hypothetical protein
MNPTLAEFELRMNEGERPNELPEPLDPFSKFVEEAALAGAIGWRNVAKFEEETSDINARADRAVRKNHTKASDFDETLVPDSQALAKFATPSDRRRQNCRVWLLSQVALGKTAHNLIAHAQRHDPNTANLLREISTEMGL